MIIALFLVALTVVYRIAVGLLTDSSTTWLSYFAPMAAIALCSAVYIPRGAKLLLPLGALLVSDIVLNIHYGASLLDPLILCRYLALAVIGSLGLLLQKRASLKTLLPASLVGSTIFYLITNAFSWMTDPGYAKTASGFVQALTVGLPQYSATPSWMFFRNSLVSDLLFTALFVGCMHFARNPERSRAGDTIPRVA